MKALHDVPDQAILGINYSGMHDSALAIVSPEGDLHFAVSLERLSRVKQDGRTLRNLLKDLPWGRIDKVAISWPECLPYDASRASSLLSTSLRSTRLADTLAHGPEVHAALAEIPCEKIYVPHQEAHAASAFWGSGFDEALCLTYDGGMLNDIWFGGLYRCSRVDGIEPLDQFDALRYAKVTTLYTFVTALLGFMPMRHEGKLTGLAAYGKPTECCLSLLRRWFEDDYSRIEGTMQWINTYADEAIPMLIPSAAKLKVYLAQIEGIRKEDMAASVQQFAEAHVLEILMRARALGWNSPNICLAGGLFANVKINQRVAESGFDGLFVAPPMTDDGTALGAAWYVAARSPRFEPKALNSMFYGPAYSHKSTHDQLVESGIMHHMCPEPAVEIASLLAKGKVVAVFQGRAEFGPRALGNRSILAQATCADINNTLNERLNRTEFMPFAPMTRQEDADDCYFDIERVAHAAEFMTVTVNCRDIMKARCPAVVHVDGTARPQIVRASSHPLIHAVLTEYKEITGNPAIVNTSFNVHEEPIVCDIEDALRGFFESALDYLYIEGIGLIAYEENHDIALRYMRAKNQRKSQKEIFQAQIIDFLDCTLTERTNWLESTGRDLIERTNELIATREVLRDRTERLELVSEELRSRTDELVSTREVLRDRTERLELVSEELRSRTDELVSTREVLRDRTERLELVSEELRSRTDCQHTRSAP